MKCNNMLPDFQFSSAINADDLHCHTIEQVLLYGLEMWFSIEVY